MTPEEAVVALSNLAIEAGIHVRVETFGHVLAGKGGLCRLDGRTMILVDEKLGPLERAGVIGLSLGRLVDERRMTLDVPARLRSYLTTGHGEIRPLVRPKPIARVPKLRLVSG